MTGSRTIVKRHSGRDQGSRTRTGPRGSRRRGYRIEGFAEATVQGASFHNWGKLELADDIHREKEVVRAVQQRHEPKLQVESAGHLIDRINFDRSDANMLGEVLRGAGNRFSQALSCTSSRPR